jgi:hypothetical protein
MNRSSVRHTENPALCNDHSAFWQRKKPKSRLSVLELSTRKISCEKDFEKIRNAEMGISLARQMRSEKPLSQI